MILSFSPVFLLTYARYGGRRIDNEVSSRRYVVMKRMRNP